MYLHGFLSSPLSRKAQQTISYWEQKGFKKSIKAPRLCQGPADSIDQLKAILRTYRRENIALIGSSLGGYYAAYLSEHYNVPAVLINPVVRPFEQWENYIGTHKNYYSDDMYTVTERHIEELRSIYVKDISHPDKIMVLVQTGDQVLDYRITEQKYLKARCIIREGGSHSYENYVSELPMIFDFLLSRIY